MDSPTHEPATSVAPEKADAERTATPVFIVGFPRSGTTWMMWLLAKLPSVVALQQSGLFHSLRDFERWWGTGHRFSSDGGAGSSSFGRMSNVLAKEDFYRVCRPACTHIIETLAASGKARFVVEQTPENLEFEETIRGIFPDARFLHVLRDPRDAALSMRRAARAWANEFPGRPIHIANRWVEYIERARGLSASTDRYLEVRYEDLKADGPAELARVAKWLGLTVDDATCTAAVEACDLDNVRSGSDLPAGFFGKGRSGSWRGELSGGDLRTIEYIVGDEMERFGYEREHPRSKEKPWRVALHEKLAPLYAKWRGRWLRATRGPRLAATHLSEELLYTQRKNSK